MKQKLFIMGLAMLSSFPSIAASRGPDRQEHPYASWTTPYVPHYGNEGHAHPLMDHLSAPVVPDRVAAQKGWKLNLVPPQAETEKDVPPMVRELRMGISMRLEF